MLFILNLFYNDMYSPTRPNPGGGGETCAETGIDIFFGKVSNASHERELTLES